MFWDNFVILCNENEKSPNAVCAELGLSTAIATKWKSGSLPRSTTIKKIADYFGVTTEALLTGQKEKSPSEIPEGLSELDAEIIKVYSTLPEEKKQQALSYLEFLHKQGGE